MSVTLNKKIINDEKIKPVIHQVLNKDTVRAYNLYKQAYANIVLLARKKSGKTTVIYNNLKKICGPNTKVKIYCPTCNLDETYKKMGRMLEKKGNYEDFKWQMNKFAPYKDTVQQGLTMLGGGITNSFNGLDMSAMSKTASTAGSMADFEQMLNRMMVNNGGAYNPQNISATPMGDYSNVG